LRITPIPIDEILTEILTKHDEVTDLEKENF